jgi:hypothetical protein
MREKTKLHCFIKTEAHIFLFYNFVFLFLNCILSLAKACVTNPTAEGRFLVAGGFTG